MAAPDRSLYVYMTIRRNTRYTNRSDKSQCEGEADCFLFSFFGGGGWGGGGGGGGGGNLINVGLIGQHPNASVNPYATCRW